MVPILCGDKDIIVMQKPAGLESQVSRGFAPDMISEIRRYLHSPQDIHSRPQGASTARPSYAGAIHRLDEPVGGIMVYGLNQRSTASLSASLQAGKVEKSYLAVVCGEPMDKQGAYVDHLHHYKENNISEIVGRSDESGKKAVLNYRVLEVINNPGKQNQTLSLMGVELLTGRHHQIKVQFAGHATPLYEGGRCGGGLSTKSTAGTVDRARKKAGFEDERWPLTLCARGLAFPHPSDGKRMEFAMVPSSGAFAWFPGRACKLTSVQERGKYHKEV